MYRNISDSIYTIVLYLRRKATCPPYFRNFWLEYKTRVASSTLAARFSITDCKCNQSLRMLETGPVARVLCQPSVICYGGRCVPPPSGKDDPWSLGGVESRVQSLGASFPAPRCAQVHSSAPAPAGASGASVTQAARCKCRTAPATPRPRLT